MLKRKYSDELVIIANQNVKEREYWLNRLSGELVKSSFPYDHRKGIGDEYSMDSLEFRFPGALFSKLTKLSTGNDLKLNMILVAGVIVLLHRYTGNKDIIIGTPIYKQTVETDFINTVLVLRNKIDENTNFKELLLEVRKTIGQAVEHKNYPVEVLFDKLDIMEVKDGYPPFEVAVFLENVHEKKYLDHITCNITFCFVRKDETIEAIVEYNSLLYRRETIERIIRHSTYLLEVFLSDVHLPLGETDILSDEEKNEILVNFNDTDVEYPKDKTLHQLFEEQVAKTPDGVAVISLEHIVGAQGAVPPPTDHVSITYKELDKKSNQLAFLLKEKGVKADTIVGIMVERSVEMMIGILGILKAGGAYLPIEPDYPQERIDFMLKDSNARVLLKKSEIRISKSETNPNDKNSNDQNKSSTPIVLNFEHLNFEFVSNFEFRASNLSSSNLAYIIYTSGTTGRPKGVMVEHRNVVAYLYAFFHEFDIHEGHTVIQLASYAFDVFVEEVYPVLLRGGKIVIPGPDELMDIRALSRLIRNLGVNIIDCTPLLLNEFNKVGGLGPFDIIISGGDVLKEEYVDSLLKVGRVYNTYGPTETTVCATYYPYYMLSERIKSSISIPIGRPISNYKVYILDEDFKLQPIGVVGELWISGVGAARGYLNRPALTAEKFVLAHSSWLIADRREKKVSSSGELPMSYELSAMSYFYKTGDLARWLPDGNIEFFGRKDAQVKIRGFRIELGEIESRLKSHDEITESVVIPRIDAEGDKSLIAYVVSNEKIESADLKDFLGQRIPAYMIPSFFVRLDHIPLTPNGKVDIKALPEPELVSVQEYVEPQNQVQEQIKKIWQQVIGIERIGIYDNFFDIGGHSLRGIQVVNALHSQFNVKVPLAEIFRTPTIQGLSEFIEGAAEAQYMEIEAVEEKEYYVLSSAQKRLFILQQMDDRSTTYNMPQVVPLGNDIDKEKLEQTLKRLILRHESFRTCFEMVNGEPVQKVQPEVSFAIEDYGGGDAGYFIRPFDLYRAPLLRVGLTREEEFRHVLLLDMHHIITDGLSQDVCMRDFIQLYRGESLEPIQIQYKDYAEWQQQANVMEAKKQQEDYWLNEFEEEISILDLPIDYQRPEVQSFEGNFVIFDLDEVTTQSLRALASSAETTLYMLVLAVVNIFLAKLSGSENIVLGTVTAGRNHVELQHVIGMFVNTLPLKNHIPSRETFNEFLTAVIDKTLETFENQDYQFEDLVEKVPVARDTGRNPLFDVMYSLDAMEDQEVDLSQVESDYIRHLYEYGYRIAKFDLTLAAVETPQKLLFNFQYCSRLFKQETIQRFIIYFNNIVSSLVENPHLLIAEIEIITGEEKEQVLYEFNKTVSDYPREKTIHQLFEEQVEKNPDSAAVVCGEHRAENVEQGVGRRFIASVTYRELNQRSNQLARRLRRKGVKPDSIIGMVIDRSVDMIIGILGILKAGGAYLPIDPEFPEARKKYMLEDSGAKLVLTRNKFISRHTDANTIINIDHKDLYHENGGNLQHITQSDHLVYVIYTSGTTGKSKGTLTTHANVIRVVRNANYIDVTGKDRILQLSNYAFDGSTFDIYGALLNGAVLAMIKKEDVLSLDILSELIKRERISVFFVTTALFNALVDVNIGCFDRIRKVLFGGERVSVNHTGRAFGYMGRDKILHMYGPTETTVYATYYPVEKIDEPLGTIPIGQPTSNTMVYILDKYLNVQPVGITGEIYIGGDGLARGYLNRPQLTAERFVHLIINTQHLTLYRTGDLARWLPDGNIVFVGRIDHQVKIRGFRIEMGEIESQLLNHAAVKETVVLTREDEYGDRYICAYFVPAGLEDVEETKASEAELKRYLSKTLPDYMIPSYVVELKQIPLNPNGKVDYRALPVPKQEAGKGYIAPRNAVEEKLVEIWAGVLGIEENVIGIDINFFHLGGHSLSATIMSARVNKAFHVRVPLATVFKTPTVRGLAEYIRLAAPEKYVSIQPVEEREFYPLSSAQKRLYILQQMELDGIGYNMPEVFPLAEEPDTKKLQETFIRLIKRHESLRTSFGMRDGQPVQKIHDQVEFEMEYYELATEDTEERKKTVFVRPFDLSRAPLLRVVVIHTPASGHPSQEGIPGDKYILLVDMHHIISDGVSHNILVQDFMALSRDEELSPLRIQYRDFAGWQNSAEQKAAMKQQESYWLKEFSGEIPVLNLPTDYTRPAVQSFEGNTLGFEIGREETAALRNLSLESDATLYMVLLAVCNVFLYRLSSQEDIVIGTPVMGRRHTDLEKIIGMFVNTLALRNYPTGEKSFKEFLGDLKKRTLEAFESQEYQFEDLVDLLTVNRDTSRNPLFDVMFTFQGAQAVQRDSAEVDTAGEEELPGEIEDGDYPLYDYERRVSKFDVTIAARDGGDRLVFAFQYCARLFTEETIKRFIGYFKAVVSAFTTDVETKLWEIELLSAEEKKQILYNFNDTAADYPKDKSLHQLFEEQVEMTPDGAAVVGRTVQLTYRELNQKSNQLARLLREKGVKPDHIVGLMVSPSVELVVSILAILKAGGAYLPLESNLPQERLNLLLEESNARIVAAGKKESSRFKTKENVLVIDPTDESIDMWNGENLEPVNRPENLVYVIYTSGSTGTPKGVILEHRSVVNYVWWAVKNYVRNEGENFPLYTSISFDLTVTSIYTPLITGNSIIVYGDEGDETPIEKIRRIIQDERLGLVKLTPAHLKAVREQEIGSTWNIKRLVLGGEDLESNLAADIHEKFNGKVEIFNEYGPTEAAVGCMLHRFDPGKDRRLSVPIGVPADNVRIYILDSYQRPVIPGVAGGMYISGDGLARGYLNQPELTAEKFLKFSLNTRLYRTGDLARWLPDGKLEFLGRTDYQVKIRGYRIELGEIESQLLSHGKIKEAVVLVREDNLGDKYLCSYIVPEPGDFPGVKPSINSSELKEYLSRLVPDYMIPVFYVELEKIPLTPSGKINRKALPVPEPEAAAKYTPPRDDLETKLVEIWSEVLFIDKEKIGIEDNFFHLGGHSLKATTLASQIHQVFGVRVPLIEIFKNTTINELARYMRSVDESGEIARQLDDQLVLLRRAAGKAWHFFFIHDGSGEVEGYIEFCRHLAADFNCWGIRADRLEGYAPRQVSIEEVAATYIEKIKTIQPHGPYNLAGWSLGGTIAFEMVRQLEQMGNSIAFFALIDVVTPHSDLLKGMKNDFTLEAELNFIQHYLPDIQMKENFANVTDIHQLWTAVKDYLETENVAPEAIRSVVTRYEALMVPDYHQLGVGALIEFMNIGRTFRNARAAYVPTHKIDTQVHYFGASVSARINNERDKWHDYCKKPMKVYTIDGDHFSIFKMPAVAGFSKLFAAVIDAAVKKSHHEGSWKTVSK